jgi:hypothetical protein
MQTIKDWLSKYNITTHSVAALFASAMVAYYAVPQFHDLVTQAYKAMPGWVEELMVTGFALYAWYRKGQPAPTPGAVGTGPVSPNANPTQKLGVIMFVVLLISSPFQTGCTAVSAAQDIVDWTPTVISTANIVSTTVSALDPSIVDKAAIAAATATFDVAAQTLSNQAAAYLANPSQTLIQVIQTQVSTFQQSVNSALLAAAKITNPASQQQVLLAIQALSVAVTAVLALVARITHSTAVVAPAAVKIARVERLMNRDLARRMVAAHYSEPQFVAAYQIDRAQAELQAAGF